MFSQSRQTQSLTQESPNQNNPYTGRALVTASRAGVLTMLSLAIAGCSDVPDNRLEAQQLNKRDYHTHEISPGNLVRCSAVNSTMIPAEVSQRYELDQSPGAGIFSCTAENIETLEATYRQPGFPPQPLVLNQFIENGYPTWVGNYPVNSRMPLLFDVTVQAVEAEPEKFGFEVSYYPSS